MVRMGPGNPGKPWNFLKPWKPQEKPGKFFLLSPGKYQNFIEK